MVSDPAKARCSDVSNVFILKNVNLQDNVLFMMYYFGEEIKQSEQKKKKYLRVPEIAMSFLVNFINWLGVYECHNLMIILGSFVALYHTPKGISKHPFCVFQQDKQSRSESRDPLRIF